MNQPKTNTIAILTALLIGGFMLAYLATTGVFGGTQIGVSVTTNPELEQGLELHFTFDGSNVDWSSTTAEVLDLSNNARHANFINIAASGSGASGKIGQGALFDGSNDYINAPNGGFDPNTSDFTFSLWIYSQSNSTQGGRDRQVVAQRDGSGTGRTWIYIDDTDNHIESFIGGSAEDSGYTISTDEWVHVTLIHNNSSNELQWYINGQLVNTNSGVNAESATGEFYIGTHKNGNGYFDGTFDDLRFYSRILSVNEISRLYDLGATTKIGKTITTNPDLENGLVGHWTFDGPDFDWTSSEPVQDQSGTNNHATLDSFTASSSVSGVLGQAMQFDGIDTRANAGSDASLDNIDLLTAAAWFYIDSTNATADRIFDKQQGGTPGFRLRYSPTGNEIRFYRGYDGGGGEWATPDNSIRAGEWMHIAVTHDRTGLNAAAMYVNGASVTPTVVSSPSGSANSDASVSLSVGGRTNGNNTWDGKIDDARIYNRILSASEISRLYGLGATTKIGKTISTNPDLENGLVGHWTFDGPTIGDLVGDVSGNNNDAFLVSNTSTSTISGKMGQAWRFDGVDDALRDAADSSYDNIQSGDNVSIAFWGKFVDDGSSYMVGAAYGEYAETLTPYLGNLGSGVADLCVAGPGTVDTCPAALNGHVREGEWYHYTATYDQQNVRLYLDGEEVYSVVETGEVADFPENFCIGSHEGSGAGTGCDDDPWNGDIDDVRFYDRALSADEIKRLYQLGGGD